MEKKEHDPRLLNQEHYDTRGAEQQKPTPPREEKYHHIDHTHCWNQKSPACGQKIEHLKCCLCEKLNPKAQGAGEKECCEKCEAIGEYYKDAEHGTTYTCGNTDCPCHTPTNTGEKALLTLVDAIENGEVTEESEDALKTLTPPSEKKTIEVNMFNRDFVEGARNAGFTDTQINFLAEHFEFKSEEYE